jgi:hypothetical protein
VTVFVRMKNGATWHWCSNCPQFPKNDIESVDVLPRDARRCRTCLDLAKSGTCTPAKVAVTPVSSSRPTQDFRSEFVERTPSSGPGNTTTRSVTGSATASPVATSTQRKFLSYEQRVMLESELRATNWLPAAEARVVKEDILIKHETRFALQGFFPKDIEELRTMVEQELI